MNRNNIQTLFAYMFYIQEIIVNNALIICKIIKYIVSHQKHKIFINIINL